MNEKEIDLIIGANVKKYRTLAGISQQQVGNILNVTFQQVQKYENGKNRISASKLVIIANKLGISINDLCNTEAPKKAEINRDALEIMKNFNGLSQRDKDFLIMCAKHLNKNEILDSVK